MWKRPVSKYKNAVAKSDSDTVLSFDNHSQLRRSDNVEHLAVGPYLVLFTNNGRSFAISCKDDSRIYGRPEASLVSLNSGFSQLESCPFYPDLFASSFSNSIQLFKVDLSDYSVVPQSTITVDPSVAPVSSFGFSRCVQDLLCVCGGSNSHAVSFVNVETQATLSNHTTSLSPDPNASISFNLDSSLVATTSKSSLAVVDSRTPEPTLTITSKSNASSKVQWLSGANSDQILTSFVDDNKFRRLAIYDIKNSSQPLYSESFGNHKNGFNIVQDWDTGMVFVASTMEQFISYYEVESFQNLTLPLRAEYNLNGDLLHKFCLADRFNLSVVDCEVNRLVVLTNNCLRFVSYDVPRKSSSGQFHDDLYPDAVSNNKPATSVADWAKGERAQPIRSTLHPTSRDKRWADKTPAAAACSDTKDKYKVKGREFINPVSAVPLQPLPGLHDKDRLVDALKSHVELETGPLRQDLDEGADSDEWEDS